MSDLLIKILFLVVGLYAGVLTWLFKTAWAKLEENRTSIEANRALIDKMKLDCATCKGDFNKEMETLIEKITDRWGAMLDEKLEAWWNKVELNLVNDGRVPPKRPNKQREGN